MTNFILVSIPKILRFVGASRCPPTIPDRVVVNQLGKISSSLLPREQLQRAHNLVVDSRNWKKSTAGGRDSIYWNSSEYLAQENDSYAVTQTRVRNYESPPGARSVLTVHEAKIRFLTLHRVDIISTESGKVERLACQCLNYTV